MTDASMHKNVGDELVRLEVGCKVIVQSQIICKVYAACVSQHERGNKKNNINNDDVLGHHRQVSKTVWPVFVIVEGHRLKNLSISLYSTSIITTLPDAVYSGFSHWNNPFSNNFISSCSSALPYLMLMFLAIALQRLSRFSILASIVLSLNVSMIPSMVCTTLKSCMSVGAPFTTKLFLPNTSRSKPS